MPDNYRLWVNEASTLLVRQWKDGTVEIAERDDPSHVWGPPTTSSTLPSWIGNLKEEMPAPPRTIEPCIDASGRRI